MSAALDSSISPMEMLRKIFNDKSLLEQEILNGIIDVLTVPLLDPIKQLVSKSSSVTQPTIQWDSLDCVEDYIVTTCAITYTTSLADISPFLLKLIPADDFGSISEVTRQFTFAVPISVVAQGSTSVSTWLYDTVINHPQQTTKVNLSELEFQQFIHLTNIPIRTQ